PLWLRIFWALTCGGVAAGLLVAGGLEAVQSVAVIAALPLCVVMLLMCYGILKGLRDEVSIQASRNLPIAPLVSGQGGLSLRQRLTSIVSHPTKKQASGFIDLTVAEAFETVASELKKRHIVADAVRLDDGMQLLIRHADEVQD